MVFPDACKAISSDYDVKRLIYLDGIPCCIQRKIQHITFDLVLVFIHITSALSVSEASVTCKFHGRVWEWRHPHQGHTCHFRAGVVWGWGGGKRGWEWYNPCSPLILFTGGGVGGQLTTNIVSVTDTPKENILKKCPQHQPLAPLWPGCAPS